MISTDLTLQTTSDSNVIAVVERLELGEPAAAPAAAGPQPPNRVARRTDEQTLVLPAVQERVRLWRILPAFRGAVLLASRDHNRIAVYSRFDAGQGTAPRLLESGNPPDVPARVLEPGDPLDVPARVLEPGDPLDVPARVLDRRAYDLVWRAGAEVPAVISPQHTPVVHFGLFTVLDNQADALMARVVATAPAALATPGLRTINFHRSHDGQRLINVGTWSSFDRFHLLLAQPGFKTGQKYWDGLATFENDYFDVVGVVAGRERAVTR